MSIAFLIGSLVGSFITTLTLLVLFAKFTSGPNTANTKRNEETIELMRERNAIDERKVAVMCRIESILCNLPNDFRK